MLSLINEIQKRDGTKERERRIERGKTIKSVERTRRDKKKSAERERKRKKERKRASGLARWESAVAWVGGGEHQRAHPALIARG